MVITGTEVTSSITIVLFMYICSGFRFQRDKDRERKVNFSKHDKVFFPNLIDIIHVYQLLKTNTAKYLFEYNYNKSEKICVTRTLTSSFQYVVICLKLNMNSNVFLMLYFNIPYNQ